MIDLKHNSILLMGHVLQQTSPINICLLMSLLALFKFDVHKHGDKKNITIDNNNLENTEYMI